MEWYRKVNPVSGTKIAAQNRNNHRRRAEIWGGSFSGEGLFPFVERAFRGKCFFGFKRRQLNKANLPGKSRIIPLGTGCG
jgi:hypothetical protein